MYMKICVVGDVLDVISCVKFQNEIFRGYNFTGVEFFIFLLILNGPYNSAALLPLPVIRGKREIFNYLIDPDRSLIDLYMYNMMQSKTQF